METHHTIGNLLDVSMLVKRNLQKIQALQSKCQYNLFFRFVKNLKPRPLASPANYKEREREREMGVRVRDHHDCKQRSTITHNYFHVKIAANSREYLKMDHFGFSGI